MSEPRKHNELLEESKCVIGSTKSLLHLSEVDLSHYVKQQVGSAKSDRSTGVNTDIGKAGEIDIS